MSDVFEEVEESIREDRFRRLWNKIMPFVVVIAVLLVVGTAVREFMVWQAGQAQAAEAEAFDAAYTLFNDGEYAEASTALKAVVDENGSFAPLAAHYLAQAQIAAGGDRAAAAETLSSHGNDGSPLERLALLKAGYMKADELSLSELETLLAPLLDNDMGFGALARELVATKAMAVGDLERADAEFNTLRFSLDAPQGVVQRSEQALAVIKSRRAALEDQ